MSNTINKSLQNNLSYGQIIYTTIISLIKNKFDYKNVTCPQMISGYSFVSPISKENNRFMNYSIGIYKKNNKKVIIKSWNGMMKDHMYYSLRNESSAASLLAKKINLKKNSTFRMPIIHKIYETQNSFSIVYEYIEGKSLENYSKKYQERVIKNVINDLQMVSKNLNKNEREKLSMKNKLFYIYSLPYLFIYAVILQPNRFILLCKTFLDCLLSLSDLRKSVFTIAHRDLTPQNIIIFDSVPYLIDCERVSLTLNDYDYSYLSVVIDTKLIAHKFNSVHNRFLRKYIAMHLFADGNNSKQIQSHYLHMLSN